MPGPSRTLYALVGRCPQPSKEGTRGTMRRRRCRAIYGDLGAADGVPDGNRCDQARASGPLVGMVGALLSPPERAEGPRTELLADNDARPCGETGKIRDALGVHVAERQHEKLTLAPCTATPLTPHLATVQEIR